MGILPPFEAPPIYHSVACDALRAGGVAMKWGPARHGPGHNYAGYHTDPDNNIIETFTELDMCEAQQPVRIRNDPDNRH
ncbi:hypothetical protein Mame_04689 (plasmid) [Martelella mediterranea DSM 17316]|uniref:Uncharacterized protein n=1 Tax=Martelella mediterranea DSM 17316 TaxID=1122214 RepID=A0A1U9Z8F4_9HYPH|nr:hypothetical protein Mame_04689 [Martelella mediterranea DSM 17316]